MKKTILVSMMLASSFAMAAKKVQSVSFATFEDAVTQFEFDGSVPSNCFFSVKKDGNGLELQMASDKNLIVYIAPDVAISLQSKNSGDDSLQTYRFPGGSVTLEAIEDAYNRVYLTTEDGTASCEQDM